MNPKTIYRCLPLLLCLQAGQAVADTTVQLHHAASADVKLSIQNTAGSVRLVAWDRPEVQVIGQLGSGTRPLKFTGNNDNLALKVEAESGSGWFNWSRDSRMGPSTLEIHAPKGASLDVNVISAPVVIDGLEGGRIQIKTISGKVRVNAQTPSLTVDSISGGIELAGHAAKASLQTVSGDILAPVLGPEASLQTVSGGIQIQGGPWRQLTLSTVSGEVKATGPLSSGGHVAIDSMSGDVQLVLPVDLSANITARSFSGDFRSDFGVPEKSRHGPGQSLSTRIGSGDSTINVETFSGDLRIRKQD